MSYAAPTPGPYSAQGQPPVGDPGTLDLPYYGIGFVDAVKRALKKYARFDGRASRGEYWWWVLGVAIVEGVLGLLATILGVAGAGDNGIGAGAWPFLILLWLVALAVIVPGIAVTVRRLHDVNMTGLLYLLVLTSIGSIVILVLALMPSNPQGVRYDRARPQV
ncbi:MAG TPA: DUF805 domain-containing protein [Microlunatus sp.]